MSAANKPNDLLDANLRGAKKVAARLVLSLDRIASMMPLDTAKVDRFSDDDENVSTRLFIDSTR